MAKKEDAPERDEIDLSRTCRFFLNPVTKTIRAECSRESLVQAAKTQPEKITFELTPEQVPSTEAKAS